mgnify:CR=1 FL=1
MIPEDTSFLEFMQIVNHEAKLIMKHQRYPYYLVLKDFRERHNIQDNLFDISLTFHNAIRFKDDYLRDSKGRWHNYGHQSNALSIHINDRENSGEFVFNFDYLTDLFLEEEIRQYYFQMMNLVEHVIQNPSQSIKDLQLISEDEKLELLTFSNSDFYPNKTIHQLFEEQVAKTPDHIALVWNGQSMTYQELNQKSNQLAHCLRGKGVGPNTLVGLMMDPSFEMFIGIFGILKSGGAYIPIDPEYPDARKKFIIQNANIRLMITTRSVDLDVEWIDLTDERRFKAGVENPENQNQSADLIYIIYTSGTTGDPNGVLINHQSVANYVQWRIKTYQLSDRDVTLQLLPFVFDGFASNIYGCLLSGGKLILGDGIENADMFIAKYQVTNMSLVPSIYKEILHKATPDSLQSLRFVVLGGDKADPEIIALSRSQNAQLTIINEYGPTENTITTTALIGMTEETLSMIGMPVSNHQVYIMDRHSNLLPVGTPGELCIGGAGLARGYLNNPELTATKFTQNPYQTGQRLYRTGDIAKRNPDGSFEFIGRVDHQIKIRGYRIELGEIENKLLQHQLIKDVVVIDKIDAEGNKYLCVYYISESDIPYVELRSHLLERFPHYMMPNFFIRLDKMPVKKNGKIDRHSLPDPEHNYTQKTNYAAPRNEMEEILVNIWRTVLNVNELGIDDNFFELGGDSIKVIQVSGLLHKYNYNIQSQDLYQWPTIRELNNHLKFADKKIGPKPVTGQVKLTPIQNWFFEQQFTNMHHWNQSILLKSTAPVNIDTIKMVFAKIVEQHDALRMVYRWNGEKMIQSERNIEEEQLFFIKQMDLTGYTSYHATMDKEIRSIQSCIDLSKGPLINLGLFHTVDGVFLLITVHHLVIDGISWRIILEDLNRLYTRATSHQELILEDKTCSFKEWAEKLWDLASDRDFLEQNRYWRILNDSIVPPLPKDMDGLEDKVKHSDDCHLKFSKNDTSKLLNISKILGIELKYILLTALGLTFRQWTGFPKIWLDFESHGRESRFINMDISRTTGWFTNVFPFALDLSKPSELLDQMISVKESFMDIPDHGFGYGIIKYLTPDEYKRDFRLNIKPEICFNYLGQIDQTVEAGPFHICHFAAGLSRSADSERPYVFEINCLIFNHELQISLNYNRNQYKIDTITQIMEHFKTNISSVMELENRAEKASLPDNARISRETWIELYRSLNKVDLSMKYGVESPTTHWNQILGSRTIDCQNIFLTGVTGFLGAHILAEILDSSKANIYCLTRGASREVALKRVLEVLNFYFPDKQYHQLIGARIFVVHGDITGDDLGIQEAEYNQLGTVVDLVIHAAALVKHLGNYQDFEKVNLWGTSQVVKFSLLFQKRMVYISSIGVSGNGQEQRGKNLVFTENDFYIGQNYSDNVYFKSKFLAENFIRNASKRGLKYTIFRVGNLTGRYSDGHFQSNIHESTFYNIIKYIIDLQFIPAEIREICGEFTPVDYCSQFIMKLISMKESEGKTFHLCHPQLIRIKEMVDMFIGLGIDVNIDYDCSFAKYEELIVNEILKRRFSLNAIPYLDPKRNLNNNYQVTVSSKITQNYLKLLNLTWPVIDAGYMSKILTYIANINFCEIKPLSTQFVNSKK